MIFAVDDIGTELRFHQPPQRIVSLVPSQSELLADLGLLPQLVGVTKFCEHPAQLKKQITVVGGTKQVHFDKIMALSPEVILCNKEENTREMVEALRDIAPVHVSDIKTITDSLRLITSYGHLFDCEDRAKALRNKIENGYKQFEVAMSEVASIPVLYVIWKNPWMVAGQDTFIHEMLTLARFKNLAPTGGSRYPEIEWESFEKRETQILLSSEPFPFSEEHVAAFQQDGWIAHRVDGTYFSWYGSRLRYAFDYLQRLRASLKI